MGLLSGRSRHASRRSRGDHDSRIPSRRKEKREEEDVVEPEQPDVAELRQRRSAYYSVPPAERRRVGSSSISRTASKRSSSTALRSSNESRKRREKRRTSTSSKPERDVKESEKRTEDYVYAQRSSREHEPDVQESSRDKSERPRSAYDRSRYSRQSSRRSLPTVLESEVTPDDSISQVAERTASETSGRDTKRRPSLSRRNTTSSKLPRVPEVVGDRSSIAPSTRSTRRESNANGTFVRRHSTPAVPTQPRLVECLTCGSDDIPPAHSAKLACSHRMCHDCLKRIFEMAVKDPAHMPPRCCTDDHIPLKHVEKLFDTKFKILFNRKYDEYHTKNRIYCPTLRCGQWIRPSHIHTSQGRKYAQCPRCRTKVCTLCNEKMHKSADCPKDPEIAKLVEQAKSEGWQRCYSCKALVERKEGCNHITCRCKAEFCIVCAAKWKTCECPWFNYSHLPNPDRLNHMRVPEPMQAFLRQFVGGAANELPPGFIPGLPPVGNPRIDPYPEVAYQREFDERRRQERLDADLARRLQLASLIEPDDENHARQEPLGLGNAAGHFMNHDFVQNAANVVMDAFGNAELGRRGERPPGRRRRTRQTEQNENHPGLAADFLGEGIVDADVDRRPERRPRRYPTM